MRLYHGTNVEFEQIDLTKSNRFKDFGQGFYLTDIRQQAAELAEKRTERDGGSPIADDGVAYLLNRYEEGSYTIEELARELKYKKLNSQYFFANNRVVSLLNRVK